ncbi:hypothetical protein F9K78_15475 [Brucella pseudintermedia]|nr:hypothetical protein F9K78_15475 [Brucella pseudintermedia]
MQALHVAKRYATKRQLSPLEPLNLRRLGIPKKTVQFLPEGCKKQKTPGGIRAGVFESLVAGARNKRFLRLVERTISKFAA